MKKIKFIATITILSLTLTNCSFYKIKTVALDSSLHSELTNKEKYVILHHNNNAIHLSNISINENGDIVSKMGSQVDAKHELYKSGFNGDDFVNYDKEERAQNKKIRNANNPKRAGKGDSSIFFFLKNGSPYNEVHLYSKGVSINKDTFPEIYTVKKEQINKAMVYSKDKRKTKLLWIIPVIVGGVIYAGISLYILIRDS